MPVQLSPLHTGAVGSGCWACCAAAVHNLCVTPKLCPCMQVMDKHLQILAQQHLETKFVKVSALTLRIALLC